jgi:hypothetical protein
VEFHCFCYLHNQSLPTVIHLNLGFRSFIIVPYKVSHEPIQQHKPHFIQLIQCIHKAQANMNYNLFIVKKCSSLRSSPGTAQRLG